jgi:hypothetical protein
MFNCRNAFIVSLFLSILNLQGRLNLGNKKQSHIYLNLFMLRSHYEYFQEYLGLQAGKV